jgi:hypothetical protein
MRALLLSLAIAAGCVPTSEIGPYVKNVSRQGAWLAVQKCTIILEGDSLSEGTCTVTHVPIASYPPGPPMQMGPPMQPPMQQPPMQQPPPPQQQRR